MRICVLQHAEHEGPGELAVWAAAHGHAVGVHHLYRGDPLPALDAFDFLFVMGGEMNIYQYRDWPWLPSESEFIGSALAQGKKVIGICLGAQLLADVLGRRVVQNSEIELGWLPIEWTSEARALFPDLPRTSSVLHWHGDAFGLPSGATRLATSEGCPEQGFYLEDRCLGLQFHLEVDAVLAKQFVESQGDWPSGRFVQTPEAVLSGAHFHCHQNKLHLHGILDRFCS